MPADRQSRLRGIRLADARIIIIMNMNATTTNSIDMPSGASWAAHARHPGYRRMFAPDALTLGIFLPLRFYEGDMRVLAGQSRLVSDIDARGFAAAWVRDIPLYDRASATPASSSTPLPTWPTSPPGRSASPWPLAAPSSRCATPSTSPNPPPPSTNSPAAASSWASPPATVPSSSPPTACNTTSAPSASPRRWPTSAACSNPAVAP